MVNKDSCVFCRIVSGELPSEKIFEDKNFLAIKTIEPKVEGHFLVIPKKHYKNFLELPKKEYEGFLKAVKDSVGTFSGDFNLVINNGRNAGQVVEHLHLHVLPRKFEDGFRLNC